MWLKNSFALATVETLRNVDCKRFKYTSPFIQLGAKSIFIDWDVQCKLIWLPCHHHSSHPPTLSSIRFRLKRFIIKKTKPKASILRKYITYELNDWRVGCQKFVMNQQFASWVRFSKEYLGSIIYNFCKVFQSVSFNKRIVEIIFCK